MKKLFVLLVALASVALCAQEVSYQVFTGPDIQDHIPFIALQRITAFKEFPYLYFGNYEYEKNYLKTFGNDAHDAVAIAFCGGKPVGLLTGMALVNFESTMPGTVAGFTEVQLDPSLFYYFGEVIVLPEFQNKGIGKQLFNALEAHAHTVGYELFSFMTVIRSDDHPQRPSNYFSPDYIWNQLGYYKTSIVVPLDWPTILPNGLHQDMIHDVVFWIKELK